jgi:predicted dehydrogenase
MSEKKNYRKVKKCVIIGCGKIAGGSDSVNSPFIRTHAKAYKEYSKCHLSAVCDINLKRAKRFAEKWNAPVYGTNTSEILKEVNPDIVSICTPTNCHENDFVMALQSGAKYIWLEKPAAPDVESFLRMKSKAKRFDAQVWINYYRRYDTGFHIVINALPRLKGVQIVRACYTKGLHHNGCHMIDLLLWLFGPVKNFEITSVLRDPHYPTISARLQHRNAVVDLIGLDYKNYSLFDLDILGNKGRIKIIDGGRKIQFENVINDKFYKGYKCLTLQKEHDGTYVQFMKYGLARGLSGQPMPGFKEELKIQTLTQRMISASGLK